MNKKDFLFILKSFLVWRIGLFAVLFFAVSFIPLQKNFLGGGMENYVAKPWLWAWANFDGEHYLSIAQRGYGFGEEPFFPLYPILIKMFGGSIWAGLILSHLFFLIGLVGLYKLVRLDFSQKVAKLTIILLLLFPTSFYFGSVYTESLFLAIVVWFFYFLAKKKWLFVTVLGSLASATRLIGAILMIPFGLFAYMYYLYRTTGDSLAFIHNITIFGEQRSSNPVLLPQVFYRYFFKILPNVNYSYFPQVFVTFLEIIVAAVFLLAIFSAFKKLKLSYFFYLTFGYLIPTLSGSFSSLPRYVLVLFPAFTLGAIYLNKVPKVFRLTIIILLSVGLVISTALFVRGFWIS